MEHLKARYMPENNNRYTYALVEAADLLQTAVGGIRGPWWMAPATIGYEVDMKEAGRSNSQQVLRETAMSWCGSCVVGQPLGGLVKMVVESC